MSFPGTRTLVYLAVNGDYGESPYSEKDLKQLLAHQDIHSVFVDHGPNEIRLLDILGLLMRLVVARSRGELDLAVLEKNAVLEALEQCDFVQKDAAQLLGISSRALNYRIGQLEITHPTWRKNTNGK